MNIVTRSLSSGAAMMAGLLLGAGVAFAQAADTPAPASGERHQRMEERCKADPQKCEEMRKRMQERHAACEKDPEACQKKREERRTKMKAECEKDPVACQQKREEMRKKHEERCKADPQKCEEWKKNHPRRPGGKPMEPPPPPQAAN